VSDAQPPEATLYQGQDSVLSLSGPALLELLRAVLAKGIPFRFCARGMSMSPFIKEADVVTVSPCPGKSVSLGQVVAFVHPHTGRLVVHRVVAIGRDACRIQGDNTSGSGEEDVVPFPYILGRVTRVERAGRRVRLGLGPERKLIALLNRRGWLGPLLLRARCLTWIFLRLRMKTHEQ
jgi:hypothetical protein